MTEPTIPEADFIRLFQEKGASELARLLGIGERRIYERRRGIEKRTGQMLVPPGGVEGRGFAPSEFPWRVALDIENGIVPIGSDMHYWPGIVSTAHRAYVRFCKEFEPQIRAKIVNGDAFDGASVSRHPSIGWETRPTVQQELEACTDRLGEIEHAAPKAERIWNLGNHDSRFETRLAANAPEFARVKGVHLKDHFPHWEPAWSTFINDDVVVKHRFKGGIHATHNNTLWSGKTMVTGHLHSLKATPFTDYNGTRWGVDTGTMAQTAPVGPQFINYLEDNPVNWRAGFAVLTFYRGQLLQPELVMVRDEIAGEVEFRGKVFTV